ncbi:MAG: molybdate ABC transporter substrate-binding protein [Parasporobacterium sp.]|nr:molybdate ABC transporter substrate-binding protein [Parasporobacterium sp.]
MKKLISVFAACALLAALLAGCGNAASDADATDPAPAPAQASSEAPAAEPVSLIVFAAASMTETLTEIGNTYMAENPNVELIFTFDSSGTLKTQIQEGADCDIFISAGQKQMNQLDITADPEVNTEGLDFVLADTRFNILENKVALVVPDGNPRNINSYDDLKAALESRSILMAMGNEDVPVGQYTQKILTFFGLDEATLAQDGCITYGTNVKDVTSQVSEAAVDCGIIYQTDAFSANLTVVDTATKEMCGQVIYPAAVLNITKNAEAANAFLEYLKGDYAGGVFEAVGFTPLS